jgi:hypothetical protein
MGGPPADETPRCEGIEGFLQFPCDGKVRSHRSTAGETENPFEAFAGYYSASGINEIGSSRRPFPRDIFVFFAVGLGYKHLLSFSPNGDV